MGNYTFQFIPSWNQLARNKVIRKTQAWNKRGNKGQVRSDITTCTRQAYYGAQLRHLVQNSDKELPDDLVRIFYAGHNIDELVQGAFDIMTEENENLVVHRQQNKPPVHMRHPDSNENLSFGVTTDYVIQHVDENVYIPFEIKSTGKETKGWYSMAYLPQNVNQLMFWVYYAKARGLKVPCANVVYIKRADYKPKQIVVSIDEQMTQGFPDAEIIHIDGNPWLEFVDKQYHTFLQHFEDGTLPDKPRVVSKSYLNTVTPKDINKPPEMQYSIPDYLCKNCNYKFYCDSNLNLDQIILEEKSDEKET